MHTNTSEFHESICCIRVYSHHSRFNFALISPLPRSNYIRVKIRRQRGCNLEGGAGFEPDAQKMSVQQHTA